MVEEAFTMEERGDITFKPGLLHIGQHLIPVEKELDLCRKMRLKTI